MLEYYQLVERRRPDLLIVNRSPENVARYYELNSMGLSRDEIMTTMASEELAFIEAIMRERPVYAIKYDPLIAKEFEYIPVETYFKLAIP